MDPLAIAGPARGSVCDPFAGKITEWVDRSQGRVRADVVHRKLEALGYHGSERTTRRVVAALKVEWRRSSARAYKPWIPEPGLWLQWDYGDGPVVDGRKTVLFCAWLAWSRFRVILALPDRTLPSVIGAWDRCFRLLGGAPTYSLTDNEKTVTDRHIARVAVRNPQIVSAAVFYGVSVRTCVPYDPESKGGSESLSDITVKPRATDTSENVGPRPVHAHGVLELAEGLGAERRRLAGRDVEQGLHDLVEAVGSHAPPHLPERLGEPGRPRSVEHSLGFLREVALDTDQSALDLDELACECREPRSRRQFGPGETTPPHRPRDRSEIPLLPVNLQGFQQNGCGARRVPGLTAKRPTGVLARAFDHPSAVKTSQAVTVDRQSLGGGKRAEVVRFLP